VPDNAGLTDMDPAESGARISARYRHILPDFTVGAAATNA